jgi:hypothetical protein
MSCKRGRKGILVPGGITGPLGDINTETCSSSLWVGHKAVELVSKKKKKKKILLQNPKTWKLDGLFRGMDKEGYDS